MKPAPCHGIGHMVNSHRWPTVLANRPLPLSRALAALSSAATGTGTGTTAAIIIGYNYAILTSDGEE